MTTGPVLPPLLTDREVATLLRCGVSKAARLRRAGELPFVPGRPPLVKLEDLLAWIEDRKLEARKQAARRRASLERTAAAIGKSAGASDGATEDGGQRAFRRALRTARWRTRALGSS
jgi:Helix-turn-helix domain